MAKVHIAEFAGIGQSGVPMQAASGLLASQEVTIGATSASTTNALNDATTIVRIKAHGDCYVAWGAGTLNAASAPNVSMDAGDFDYFPVQPGANWKVAVIERT